MREGRFFQCDGHPKSSVWKKVMTSGRAVLICAVVLVTLSIPL